MSTDKNRMTTEEVLFKGLDKDTKLHKITLGLARIETNPDRLRDMLFGLQIGNKRDFIKDLKKYVDNDATLKDEKRKEYLDSIKENEEIYDEIEQVLLDKLGLDRVEYDIKKYQGVRDNPDDFRESHVEIMLRSNLKTITNTQKMLQQRITDVEVTEENAKYILRLMNETVDETVDWIKFVKSQKEKGKFDLFDDEYIDLLDETLDECKKTLAIDAQKRERIEQEFPDIAREVDEEEMAEQESGRPNNRNNREPSDDGDER